MKTPGNALTPRPTTLVGIGPMSKPISISCTTRSTSLDPVPFNVLDQCCDTRHLATSRTIPITRPGTRPDTRLRTRPGTGSNTTLEY